MVRMSDLLKVKPAKPSSYRGARAVTEKPKIIKQTSTESIVQRPVEPAENPTPEKFLPADNEGLLYAQLLAQTRTCYESMRMEEKIALGHLPDLTSALIRQMSINASEFMRLAIAEPQAASLTEHAVNVAILMTQVGLELELNPDLIQDLALVGLLHDVGMVKFEHLIQYPGPWKEGQQEHVREHPHWSRRVLAASKELPQFVANIAVQEHERNDGSGYPYGLKGANLDEYGQLLGLLDMYESLIHYRPFRERLMPSEAVRLLVQNHRSLFSDQTFKQFLTAIPVYPVGTWVRLSTGELAKVLDNRRENPLLPTVMVSRVDAQNQVIAREKWDLSKQRGVSVAGAAPSPRAGN